MLEAGSEFVAYHAGEEVSFDCGSCHATGFSRQGNQDDRPGMAGSFAQPGVECEACHGPGSLHVNNPYGFAVKVSRDAQECRGCHTTSNVPVTALATADGFIQHTTHVYGDLYPGKHALIDCVDCHDPHAGAAAPRAVERQTALRSTCEACHFQQAQAEETVHLQIRVACDTCHMPQLIQNAIGDQASFMADVKTHQVVINPNQMSQFAEDGSIRPQLSVETACRQCHNSALGIGPNLPDDVLQDAADGYHDPEPAAVIEEEASATP